MVDHLIYGAIGFLLGGLIGGSVVGSVVAKDLKKQIDELDERTKLLIDENEKLRNGIMEKREAKIRQKAEKVEKQFAETAESLRKGYDTVSESKSDDNEEDEEEDPLECDYEVPDIGSGPHMISESFFNNALSTMNADKLTYYQPNDMLVDSTDTIVFDEESMVGADTMDFLQDTKNDVVYVVDDNTEWLYEITVEHDTAYQRDVASI